MCRDGAGRASHRQFVQQASVMTEAAGLSRMPGRSEAVFLSDRAKQLITQPNSVK